MAAVSSVLEFVSCPQCGTRVRRRMNRCGECGSAIVGDDKARRAAARRAADRSRMAAAAEDDALRYLNSDSSDFDLTEIEPRHQADSNSTTAAAHRAARGSATSARIVVTRPRSSDNGAACAAMAPASSMSVVSKKRRAKRDWNLDLEPKALATLLKRGGIVAAVTAVIGGLFLLSGSSGDPKIDPAFQIDLANAYPAVQFKLILGGKEVEEAIVALHNIKGDKTTKVVGSFDPDTNWYRLITYERSKKKGGAPVGAYVLTVKAGRKARVKIPARYSDPATSGLTVQILPGDNALPPFELTP